MREMNAIQNSKLLEKIMIHGQLPRMAENEFFIE